MTAAEPGNALFRSVPLLEPNLPWVSLGVWPTPVARVAPPEGWAGDLWVKRDDLSSPIYGGNKVRKLEYLLGDALRVGARRLITTGVVGSHHCLATSVHGRRLGLATSLVLFPQPPTAHAREVEALNREWADEIHLCSGFAAQPFAEAALRWRRRRDRPYVIPPGGSNALGTLGYVTGALELAEQVRHGDLPRPDTIVVAAGTLGTVAGLAMGSALTDLTDRILAVRIVPAVVANAWTLSHLVETGSRLLADAGADVADTRAVVDRVELTGDYLGDGYGHPTAEGDQATAWFARRGIPLDPSYTAKTAAALLDHLRGQPPSVVLYWHTLSATTPPAPPAPPAPDAPAPDALPGPGRQATSNPRT